MWKFIELLAAGLTNDPVIILLGFAGTFITLFAFALLAGGLVRIVAVSAGLEKRLS